MCLCVFKIVPGKSCHVRKKAFNGAANTPKTYYYWFIKHSCRVRNMKRTLTTPVLNGITIFRDDPLISIQL